MTAFIPVLAAVTAFCVPAGAAGSQPVAVVDAFMAAYNRHDLDGMRATLLKDAAIVRFGGEQVSTGEGVIKAYADATFKVMPDVRLELVERLESHDVVAQSERVTATGLKPEVGVSIYRVTGGCIDRMEVVLEPKPSAEGGQ